MIKAIVIALLVSVAGYGGAASMQEQSRRDDYIVAHDDELSSEIKSAIGRGRVRLGMTKGQVLASWGQPTVIHTYAAGRREQWLYRRFSWMGRLLPYAVAYFEDGELINWKSTIA